MAEHPTAAVVIIGDEILKGQVQDTNSHFLCKGLYSLGVQVCQIVVVPDSVDVIAQAILPLSQKYTFVLTSGGIGPTHDDRTYCAIAKAFDDELIENKTLLKVVNAWCLELGIREETASKMAFVPSSSQLHFIKDNGCKNLPVVSVRNVYMFPGIPSCLHQAFESLKHIFASNGSEYFNKVLYLGRCEFEILPALNEAAELFEGGVTFGSYPDLDSELYKVRIVLESDAEQLGSDAEAFLRSALPPNSVVASYELLSPASTKKVYNLVEMKSASSSGDVSLGAVVSDSITILEECFARYSNDSVALSFNGGKDCTALLHLACAIRQKWIKNSPPLKAVYVQSVDPFPEVEDFIQQSVQRYNLQLVTYNGPIKEALTQLKKDYPQIQAMLMGTRRSDPYSATLQAFQKTDPDWPEFMRVCSLLHWNYHHVWDFFRVLDIPYCSLYDYTHPSMANPIRYPTLDYVPKEKKDYITSQPIYYETVV